jgi:hypothetical protein
MRPRLNARNDHLLYILCYCNCVCVYACMMCVVKLWHLFHRKNNLCGKAIPEICFGVDWEIQVSC